MLNSLEISLILGTYFLRLYQQIFQNAFSLLFPTTFKDLYYFQSSFSEISSFFLFIRSCQKISYFHVNYVLSKLKKNPELSNEIKIAKAFCHGNDCYGAESYIRGFSGYALEILIIYYKSFLKFINAIADGNDKIVIDIEKMYENKRMIKN